MKQTVQAHADGRPSGNSVSTNDEGIVRRGKRGRVNVFCAPGCSDRGRRNTQCFFDDGAEVLTGTEPRTVGDEPARGGERRMDLGGEASVYLRVT